MKFIVFVFTHEHNEFHVRVLLLKGCFCVQDPNHNKIQYRSEVMGQDGVVEGSLGLADQPVFGDWTISVKIQVLGPFSHYFYWAFSVKVQVLQSVITFTGPSLSRYRYSSRSLLLLGLPCQGTGTPVGHYFYWAFPVKVQVLQSVITFTGPSLSRYRYSSRSLLLLGLPCQGTGTPVGHYFYWAFSVKVQVLQSVITFYWAFPVKVQVLQSVITFTGPSLSRYRYSSRSLLLLGLLCQGTGTPVGHYFYWAFSVKVQVLQPVITFTGPSLSRYRYSSRSLLLLGLLCQGTGTPVGHYFYWAFPVKVQVLQSVITFTGPCLSRCRYSSQSLLSLGQFCQVFGDWTISVKSQVLHSVITFTGSSLSVFRYSIQTLLLLGFVQTLFSEGHLYEVASTPPIRTLHYHCFIVFIQSHVLSQAYVTRLVAHCTSAVKIKIHELYIHTLCGPTQHARDQSVELFQIVVVVVFHRFYTALFSAVEQTRCACM